METNKKKLSLLACIAMGIGSIIGASIFAITPIAIKIVGNGVVWGFFLAAGFLVLKTLPEFIISSSIPANGGNYMGLSRLVHPSLGCLQTFNDMVKGVMKIATLSLTFSTYFMIVFPNLLPPVIVTIILIFIYTYISLMGVKTSAIIQNISVAVLFVALGTYVFGGWPNVTIDPMDVIIPTVKITKMWAVMGMLHGSLMGANALVYFADEIENPRKNIPLAFLISTSICVILFAIIAFVTVGVVPVTEMGAQGPVIYSDSYSLGFVAERFMGNEMLAFFVTGGALLAVVTSLNAIMIMFSRAQFVAARDGLYPKVISKMNKHNVPSGAIIMNSAIAILAVVSGFNLEDVVKITTIPGLLLNPILYLVIFVLPKKYPNCYRSNFFGFKHRTNVILVVVATCVSVLLGMSMLTQMTPKHYLSMMLFYSLAGVYTVIRRKWLLNNEKYDLFEKMKEPYKPWTELENRLSKKAS